MQRKPILIFDCSGLNKLADAADSTALIAGLTQGYFLRITSTSLEEIAACGLPRSRKLMNVVKRLVYAGECILPFSMIVKGLIEQSTENESANWQDFNPRFINGEIEAARQQLLTDEMAELQREALSRLDDNFKAMFEAARPQFDKFFAEGGHLPNDFQELASLLQENPSTYWTFGTSVYEDSVGHRPSEQKLKSFLDHCPPFRALVWAFCIAEYDLCIRDIRTGPSYRAGRCDLYSAAYLPYCDQFVTDDKKQCAALQQIVKAANLDSEVLLYPEFISRTFGLNP